MSRAQLAPAPTWAPKWFTNTPTRDDFAEHYARSAPAPWRTPQSLWMVRPKRVMHWATMDAHARMRTQRMDDWVFGIEPRIVQVLEVFQGPLEGYEWVARVSGVMDPHPVRLITAYEWCPLTVDGDQLLFPVGVHP